MTDAINTIGNKIIIPVSSPTRYPLVPFTTRCISWKYFPKTNDDINHPRIITAYHKVKDEYKGQGTRFTKRFTGSYAKMKNRA
jgi:hypothetical protein